MTQCKICGTFVPVSTLSEHLLADARMLRVIKASRPEWGRQECEEHLSGILWRSQR
jgi:hypothetical protein